MSARAAGKALPSATCGRSGKVGFCPGRPEGQPPTARETVSARYSAACRTLILSERQARLSSSCLPDLLISSLTLWLRPIQGFADLRRCFVAVSIGRADPPFPVPPADSVGRSRGLPLARRPHQVRTDSPAYSPRQRCLHSSGDA